MHALVDRVWAALRASRRAAIYAVLAAFVAQGLLIQGHWHSTGGLGLAAVAGALDQPDRQQPTKGDQNNCPICHAASAAGVFFASAPPILRVPALMGYLTPRHEQLITVVRVTAHWRSRAPPSV